MPYPLKSPIVQRMTLHNPQQEGNYLLTLDVWRYRLRKDTERRKNIPYDEAINLYSEAVSWYQPYYPKSTNGRPSEPMQKFAAEYFKTSYEAIEERFGYTKRVAKKAYKFLEARELLERIAVNKRYGGELYIKLNFAQYLKISEPILPEGWMQAALEQADALDGQEARQRPHEIRGYNRFLLESLAESLVLMICGADFIKLKTWLSTLNERQLENALVLCVSIIKFPENYNTVREWPRFIRGIAESGERVDAPLLVKDWIYQSIEKMLDRETPDFMSLY